MIERLFMGEAYRALVDAALRPTWIAPQAGRAYIAVMSFSKVFGAMRRGFSKRCPHCNEGPLLRRYLKVQETCEVCGHDNGQYPADDGPAYFTILIVGHLFVAPALALPFVFDWPVGWVLAFSLSTVTLLTLWLLPRIKGAVIGLQWALREIEGRVPGQGEVEPF